MDCTICGCHSNPRLSDKVQSAIAKHHGEDRFIDSMVAGVPRLGAQRTAQRFARTLESCRYVAASAVCRAMIARTVAT